MEWIRSILGLICCLILWDPQHISTNLLQACISKVVTWKRILLNHQMFNVWLKFTFKPLGKPGSCLVQLRLNIYEIYCDWFEVIDAIYKFRRVLNWRDNQFCDAHQDTNFTKGQTKWCVTSLITEPLRHPATALFWHFSDQLPTVNSVVGSTCRKAANCQFTKRRKLQLKMI